MTHSSSKGLRTALVVAALNLCWTGSASANAPSLHGRPLSISTRASLLLDLPGDATERTEGDLAPLVGYPDAKTRGAERDLRWLAPGAPSDVTRTDATRVHRGRILLASGIPALIAGPLAIAWSRPTKKDQCYLEGDTTRPILITGVALTAVGFGLSLGGIASLVRASKEARHARKSRQSRIRVAFAATGAALLSSVMLVGVGTANMLGCYSS